MQKKSEHSTGSHYGFSLLVVIFLGLLFFGTYLGIERFSGGKLPSIGIALSLLSAFLFFSALIYLFFRFLL